MSESSVEWDGDPAPEGSPDTCDGAGDDALESAPRDARSRRSGSGVAATPEPGDHHRHRRRRPALGAPRHRCPCRLPRGRDPATGLHPAHGPVLGVRLPGSARQHHGSQQPLMGARRRSQLPGQPDGPPPRHRHPPVDSELWTSHGFGWACTPGARTPCTSSTWARRKTPLGPALRCGPPSGRRSWPGRGEAPRRRPAFPLPAGHCFGRADGSPLCHDGHVSRDRPHIAAVSAGWSPTTWNLARPVSTAAWPAHRGGGPGAPTATRAAGRRPGRTHHLAGGVDVGVIELGPDPTVTCRGHR